MSDLPAHISENAPRPDGFDADAWSIMKRAGKRVAARHKTTGEARKLPAAWFTIGESDGESEEEAS